MIEAVREITRILNDLGLRWYAGGSVASSTYGIARFTQDLDLVVDLPTDQIETLAAQAGVSFYADAEQMRDALRYGRSFNLIHFASGFKIDIFPARQGEFEQGEMERAAQRTWHPAPSVEIPLMIASPEDVLLEKLRWYQQGGGTSDRQWSDMLGLLSTSPMDWPYIERWASALCVDSEFARLRREAGV